MTPRDFCYWLQGYFEMKEDKVSEINERETKIIKDHLNLVFTHVIDTKPSEESKPVTIQPVGRITVRGTGNSFANGVVKC